MGGGGRTMKAAVKAASISLAARGSSVLGSLSPSARVGGQSLGSQSDPSLSAAIVSPQNVDAVAAAVQGPAAWDWEMGDWEFASGQGDPVRSMTEPPPRVVFGGVPSYDEAEAATAELKDAVEKLYSSSHDSGEVGSPRSVALDLILLLEHGSETESVATSDSSVTPAFPGHASQAFTLLRQNPAAQRVIASIASDPNVLKAALRNEAFMQYYHSQRTRSTQFFNEDSDEGPSIDDDHRYQDWFSHASDQFKFLHGGIADMVRSIKLTAVDMVTSVSSYLQSIFSLSEADKEAAADTGSGSGFSDRTLGASFLGLAMMVIMIVLLKRALIHIHTQKL